MRHEKLINNLTVKNGNVVINPILAKLTNQDWMLELGDIEMPLKDWLNLNFNSRDLKMSVLTFVLNQLKFKSDKLSIELIDSIDVDKVIKYVEEDNRNFLSKALLEALHWDMSEYISWIHIDELDDLRSEMRAKFEYEN